ncbi:hypothetical protein [Streptomyces cadmiisoli]|uniref:hypothetical protein n=1 Tax=Streptomyces cadmiisoli TaxID=2184053 RepID=UPI00365B29F3
MARIQILELPTEHHGDDMITPFVLVFDQVQDPEAFTSNMEPFRVLTGAKAVLVSEELVEIPANEVPVDPDGYPLKIRVEGDFDTFREQVQDQIRKAQAEIGTAGLRRSI